MIKILTTKEIFSSLLHELDFSGAYTESQFLEFAKAVYNNDIKTQVQPQNENLNIEIAPSLNEIINKISDLLVKGRFPAGKETYNYRIKTSVKEFVKKLKDINLTDESSKKVIFNNILLRSNANKENDWTQAEWASFTGWFSRNY